MHTQQHNTWKVVLVEGNGHVKENRNDSKMRQIKKDVWKVKFDLWLEYSRNIVTSSSSHIYEKCLLLQKF
jgi:hypothetical protein